jgi:hypothetical protein
VSGQVNLQLQIWGAATARPKINILGVPKQPQIHLYMLLRQIQAAPDSRNLDVAGLTIGDVQSKHASPRNAKQRQSRPKPLPAAKSAWRLKVEEPA